MQQPFAIGEQEYRSNVVLDKQDCIQLIAALPDRVRVLEDLVDEQLIRNRFVVGEVLRDGQDLLHARLDLCRKDAA